MLDKVKKSLLIPLDEHYADEELLIHIASCRHLLITSGIPSEIAESNDHPLVEALILIFVKTNFGFKADGSVKELPKSFDVLLRQLCLASLPEVNGVPHDN